MWKIYVFWLFTTNASSNALLIALCSSADQIKVVFIGHCESLHCIRLMGPRVSGLLQRSMRQCDNHIPATERCQSHHAKCTYQHLATATCHQDVVQNTSSCYTLLGTNRSTFAS